MECSPCALRVLSVCDVSGQPRRPLKGTHGSQLFCLGSTWMKHFQANSVHQLRISRIDGWQSSSQVPDVMQRVVLHVGAMRALPCSGPRVLPMSRVVRDKTTSVECRLQLVEGIQSMIKTGCHSQKKKKIGFTKTSPLLLQSSESLQNTLQDEEEEENAFFFASPYCPGPSGNCRGAASMKLRHNTSQHPTVAIYTFVPVHH